MGKQLSKVQTKMGDGHTIKHSRSAQKALDLLKEGRVVEARMELIFLVAVLRLEENVNETIKKSKEIFDKTFQKERKY